MPAIDEADPASYHWALYDRILAAAEARGLRVLLTVTGPGPRWATRSREDRVTRPSPTRFRRFVTAVGRRYRDQVDHWSVWNEPNHPDFLAPQYVHGRPYSPRLYRQLFRAARAGLNRSGNARDRVLMGETAPRGNSHVVAPLGPGEDLIAIDRVFLHERTGSVALKSLAAAGRDVADPARIFAVTDHIIDTLPGRTGISRRASPSGTLMPVGTGRSYMSPSCTSIRSGVIETTSPT